ncbi:hypothetical protein AB0K09_10430 [Streptomyces sp. NPDC049577]|uniref:hypothetical protein n=1 Tax=Streptomyces sp. NPDC049577 TaxID=3155153 RepID=UPI003438C7A5
MRLIHVRLRTHRTLPHPDTIAAWLKGACAPADGLEHVSVHVTGSGELTLGLFLGVPDLLEAERSALRLARLSLRGGPLRDSVLVACGAVLVPSYYDRLLAGAPFEDGTGQDRKRPGDLPSDRPDVAQD